MIPFIIPITDTEIDENFKYDSDYLYVIHFQAKPIN